MGFDSVLQDVPIDEGLYLKNHESAFNTNKNSTIDNYMNDFGE